MYFYDNTSILNQLLKPESDFLLLIRGINYAYTYNNGKLKTCNVIRKDYLKNKSDYEKVNEMIKNSVSVWYPIRIKNKLT